MSMLFVWFEKKYSKKDVVLNQWKGDQNIGINRSISDFHPVINQSNNDQQIVLHYQEGIIPVYNEKTPRHQKVWKHLCVVEYRLIHKANS